MTFILKELQKKAMQSETDELLETPNYENSSTTTISIVFFFICILIAGYSYSKEQLWGVIIFLAIAFFIGQIIFLRWIFMIFTQINLLKKSSNELSDIKQELIEIKNILGKQNTKN